MVRSNHKCNTCAKEQRKMSLTAAKDTHLSMISCEVPAPLILHWCAWSYTGLFCQPGADIDRVRSLGHEFDAHTIASGASLTVRTDASVPPTVSVEIGARASLVSPTPVGIQRQVLCLLGACLLPLRALPIAAMLVFSSLYRVANSAASFSRMAVASAMAQRDQPSLPHGRNWLWYFSSKFRA